MSFPQGINFRATIGYVTDGANDYGEIATTNNYPTTSTQGNSVGWETNPNSTRDRNSGNDPRLAGVNQTNQLAINQSVYRIDLDATGSRNVNCAIGDASFATVSATCILKDTTTTFATPASLYTTSGANQFVAANGTEYSAANWVTNQGNATSQITRNFTTTIFRAYFGDNTVAAFVTQAAHLWAGAGPAVGGKAGARSNHRPMLARR